MSYIGNSPTTTAFVTDTFNGTGSATVFTMSVAPATTTSILVSVTGVLQDPSTYSVSGTTLTFSSAPPAGTGNISVRYLGIPASGVTTTAYRTVTEFTATAGQTTFSTPSYTVGYIDVYRNGVRLGSSDFTATTGTTVVLTSGAAAGDLVVTESFYVSSVLNAIPATVGAINSTYLSSGLSLTSPTLSDPTFTGTATGTVLVSGTAVTASGTAVNFTGIPSWVKRITVMFSGVSTSGTSIMQIQLGTSGGIQTSSYVSSNGQVTAAAAACVNTTTGFGLGTNATATDASSGSVILTVLDSSTGTWTAFGATGAGNGTQIRFTGGAKVLSGTLDRIRITTVNGTDTFDAGTINIMYE